MAELEVDHLSKFYGKKHVVKNVSFSMTSGDITGLLGPNGAGKTTSFYMIVGFIKADGGSVKVDGHDITKLPMHKRSKMGLAYLPQEASIFRKLTVEENIKLVLQTQKDMTSSPTSVWKKYVSSSDIHSLEERGEGQKLQDPLRLLPNFCFLMSRLQESTRKRFMR